MLCVVIVVRVVFVLFVDCGVSGVCVVCGDCGASGVCIVC